MEARMQVQTGSGNEETRRSREAIEAIEPDTALRELTFNWKLPDGRDVEKTYTQAELGMFPVQEFTTLVTEVVESFTQGDMGMKIGDLFRGDIEMPEDFSPGTVNKVVEENMALVQAFIKAVQMLPGFQLDIMCLSLGIPRHEREWAKGQLQEPPHRGGLTVQEGFDILIWFIRQNAELCRETFLGKARELVDEFRLHVLQEDPTASSDSTDSETTTETPADPSSSPGGTPSSISSPDTPVSV